MNLEIFDILTEDYRVADTNLKIDGCGYNKRTFIRCIVSLIEADLHVLRSQLANRIVERYELYGELNIHLLTLLMDESPSISNSGEITLRRKEESLTRFCKFLHKQNAKLSECEINLFEGKGWDDFQEIIKIRNRITHPKELSDISVSLEDIERSKNAINWYLGVKKSLHSAEIARLKRKNNND